MTPVPLLSVPMAFSTSFEPWHSSRTAYVHLRCVVPTMTARRASGREIVRGADEAACRPGPKFWTKPVSAEITRTPDWLRVVTCPDCLEILAEQLRVPCPEIHRRKRQGKEMSHASPAGPGPEAAEAVATPPTDEQHEGGERLRPGSPPVDAAANPGAGDRPADEEPATRPGARSPGAGAHVALRSEQLDPEDEEQQRSTANVSPPDKSPPPVKPHLSASQIDKFLKCPRAWAYQYVRGIKSDGSGATVQGSAWHAVIEAGYREVIKGHELPAVSDLQALFRDEFTDRLSEGLDMQTVVLRAGEHEDELLHEGLDLVEAHRTKIAPYVRPAEVERKIIVSLGDEFPFDLLGYLDVITQPDETGRQWIRDNKARSAKRGTPRQNELDRDVQLGVYALLYRAEYQRIEGGLALDVCVKPGRRGAGVEAVSCETQRTAAQVEWILSLIEQMARSVVAKAYPPTLPGNWWCLEKWCSYWDLCQVRGDWEMEAGRDG